MAEGVDTIARHTFSKERQPQAMSDTISLISHPSKIMHLVNLNQLKALAEELLAEEQVGLDLASRLEHSRTGLQKSRHHREVPTTPA